MAFLTHEGERQGFSVVPCTEAEIDALSIGSSHGGIIAFCTERTLPKLSAERLKPNGFYVFLEGVEDPYNFGYTIRSLYAAGVDGVVLPPRNWMSAAGVVARASAGASESLPIFEAEGEDAVRCFRETGYTVLCAGIRDSVSVFEEQFDYPILLVVGGEKRGISRTLLDAADRIVRIDYGRDFGGSLSAASAATVLAFEIFRQNRSK